VISVVVDEDRHSMDVVVDEDNLAIAIGRGGQNVRLASEMTGWTINLMTEEESQTRVEAESAAIRVLFIEKLDVDEEVANILIGEGFSTLEEVAYVPLHEMNEIEAFDETTVQELRDRARNVLLTEAIVTEEQIGEVAEDMLALEGMDKALAGKLASKDIKTRDDLADLAVDELTELTGIDAERATQLITTARAHWFE
jgi:N utilization substance protein A